MISNVSRFCDLLKKCGSEKIKIYGKQILCQCIFHPDRHPSLSISIEKEVGHCFGCGIKGTVRGIFWEYARRNRIPYEYFRREFDEILDGFDDEWWDTEELKIWTNVKDVLLKEEGVKYIQSVIGKIPRYVFKRGVSLEVVRLFLLGYDKDRKRIVFPIRNIDGVYVGFATRSLKRRDYKFNSGFVKNALYGEYEAIQNSGSSELIIVEGFFDVLKLKSYGYNVVGSLGTALTAGQLKKICLLLNQLKNPKVKILLDGDEAGKIAARQMAEMISSLTIGVASAPEVEIKECIAGKDPADLTKEELDEILK